MGHSVPRPPHRPPGWGPLRHPRDEDSAMRGIISLAITILIIAFLLSLLGVI